MYIVIRFQRLWALHTHQSLLRKLRRSPQWSLKPNTSKRVYLPHDFVSLLSPPIIFIWFRATMPALTLSVRSSSSHIDEITVCTRRLAWDYMPPLLMDVFYRIVCNRLPSPRCPNRRLSREVAHHVPQGSLRDDGSLISMSIWYFIMGMWVFYLRLLPWSNRKCRRWVGPVMSFSERIAGPGELTVNGPGG